VLAPLLAEGPFDPAVVPMPPLAAPVVAALLEPAWAPVVAALVVPVVAPVDGAPPLPLAALVEPPGAAAPPPPPPPAGPPAPSLPIAARCPLLGAGAVFEGAVAVFEGGVAVLAGPGRLGAAGNSRQLRLATTSRRTMTAAPSQIR
jgi:hypothetical protein